MVGLLELLPTLLLLFGRAVKTGRTHFRGADGYGGNTALTVFGQFMKNIYEDENITDVLESDVFKYSNFKIKNYVNTQLNCKQLDLINPEQNIDYEEF